MSTSNPTLEPLSPEHQAAYLRVLQKVTSLVTKVDIAKRALGQEGVELIGKQLQALETANNGYPVQFDTRYEAREFHGTLMHNFRCLEKRFEAFHGESKALLDQVYALGNDEKYNPWLTDAGRLVVQRPMLLVPVLARELGSFPARVAAMRATIIASGEAIKQGTGVEAFEYALHSIWNNFLRFYSDLKYLMQSVAPAFKQYATAALDIYTTVDNRIAAKEARLAQEAAAAAAAAKAAEEAEAWTPSADELPNGGSHPPADTYTYAEEHDSEPMFDYSGGSMFDYSSGPMFNSANGMMMMPNSNVDILGNMYGTDCNHF